MIVLDVDATSAARIRFSASPAHELLSWLRLASSGRRHPLLGDVGAAARSALRLPDVALVTAVLPPGVDGYVLDLLTPAPGAGRGWSALEHQLAVMAATPAEEVRQQVRLLPHPVPPAVQRVVDAGGYAPRVAMALRRYWDATLANDWGRVQQALDSDIARRAALLADVGVGTVLNGLHSSVCWTEGRLLVDKPYAEQNALAGAPLVLSPTLLGWPRVAAQLCCPANAFLAYPAAEISSRPARLRPAAALIGDCRSRLLHDLSTPRSTTELAMRHHVSAPTVSYHLRVLLGTGLVSRRRTGRVVLYRRTAQADTVDPPFLHLGPQPL